MAAGALTVTCALALALPPGPVHCRVKVLVPADSTALVSLPEGALSPLQASEAVQELASVEDHCSVVVPPAVSVAGFALRVTVGSGVGAGAFTVIRTSSTIGLAVPSSLALRRSTYAPAPGSVTCVVACVGEAMLTPEPLTTLHSSVGVPGLPFAMRPSSVTVPSSVTESSGRVIDRSAPALTAGARLSTALTIGSMKGCSTS